MRSSRLVAPITMTFLSDSTPSISLSNCGTTVDSTSELTPDPRVRNSESISSKNTTTGRPSAASSRARENTRRTWRSVSPTYLLSNSGPLTLRNELPAAFATAFAIIVLPHPGGP